MRRMHIVLAVVLVIQLVLAGVLAHGVGGRHGAVDQGPLLSLGSAQPDHIAIADDKGRTLKLVKTDGSWQLPARWHFPAAETRVTALIVRLKAMPAQLPVATTANAQKRFDVGDKHFVRRISLRQAGNTLATLYLGDSAGPGEVYARVAGSSTVQEVRFKLWTATTDPADWLAEDRLQQDKSTLQKIVLPGMTLKHKNNAWELAHPGQGRTTDADKAEQLVTRLASLHYRDVAGRRDAMTLSDPVRVWSLVDKQGDKTTYRLYRPAVGETGQATDDARAADRKTGRRQPSAPGAGGQKTDNDRGKTTWWLTASDNPYVFSIKAQAAEQLRKTDRKALVIDIGSKPADDSEHAARNGHDAAADATGSAVDSARMDGQ